MIRACSGSSTALHRVGRDVRVLFVSVVLSQCSDAKLADVPVGVELRHLDPPHELFTVNTGRSPQRVGLPVDTNPLSAEVLFLKPPSQFGNFGGASAYSSDDGTRRMATPVTCPMISASEG
jgi:hypothetical protein